MATVFIPASLRALTAGRNSVEAAGATVRQIIEDLDRSWPGLRDRLMDQDRLRPNISVAVDGEVSPLGLLEQVPESGEVHFVFAIKGGRGSAATIVAMKMLLAALGLAVAGTALLWSVSRPADIAFHKHTIDLGANESCAIADVNKDGRLDIIAGENWYAAPKWTKARFRTVDFNNNYIDNFSDLPLDVNGDGWVDIVSAHWFSRQLDWWENPGRKGDWKQHVIESGMNVEFAFLVDLNNDGRAEEVLPQFGGRDAITAWYERKDGKFVRHKVSEKGFGHGIGAGDVNGDGKNDVLTPKGWFEAPDWKWHPDWDSKEALSFIHVYDVNGDKRNDILFGHAHDYGLAWMDRGADGSWAKRLIDDTWSQAHAVTLVDLNGDGKKDVVTGKRYMAHEHENGAREPNGIYWYETITIPPPIGKDQMQWVKHVIDYSTRAGGGMQVEVADIDGDRDLDIAVGGKLGVFLFENKTR